MASIDGLASGLNTGDIIKQLMSLERLPQTRLQTKQKGVESAIAALRNLNTQFLAISTAATKLTTPQGWQLTKATSSDATRVSASATAGAAKGSLSFSVNQLATAGSYITKASVAATTDSVATAGSTITLTKGTTSTSINVGDGSLKSVADAINAAGAGVTATTVQTSTGAYRLQLSSTTTGENTGISIGLGLLETNTFLKDLNTVAQPKDAVLVLGGGTPLADGSNTVKRATNTISDLMTGVTLGITKADSSVLVTVDVQGDTEGLAAQVAGLVETINAASGDIRAATGYNLETKAKGKLYGDAAVRGLRDRLGAAVVGDGTTSAGLAGVSVGRDGTVSFDKTKFLAAIAKDPAAVEKALGKDGLAGRVNALAETVTRPKGSVQGPGLVAGAISSRESQIKTLTSGIAEWDNRLELREASLRRQYASLEKALGAAQSQGQWLAGQIAGLPSYG